MLTLGPVGEAIAAMVGIEVPPGAMAALMNAAVETTPALLVSVAMTVGMMKAIEVTK